MDQVSKLKLYQDFIQCIDKQKLDVNQLIDNLLDDTWLGKAEKEAELKTLSDMLDDLSQMRVDTVTIIQKYLE